MAQSVIRQIERNLTASAGLQSRPTDKASIRGIHQGQRSCEIAQKGRTHDCKRPLLITKKLLQVGGHPHMRRPYIFSEIQVLLPSRKRSRLDERMMVFASAFRDGPNTRS